MKKNELRKLTSVQREVLQLLDGGDIITIDRFNMAAIGERNIASSTRYSLTDNRYIERKDKTKAVTTSGNGFVITERGRMALVETLQPKKRIKSNIIRKEKMCRGCNSVKPIDEFVTIYGVRNPRAKYCQSCFAAHQQEHAKSLMEGRDFCLYCGTKIEKAYDWTPEGRSAKTYLHLDHMDPLSLGGEASDKNTVCCCVACNLRKGNKLFVNWLAELEAKYREIARRVYIEKHQRDPEIFIPLRNEIIIEIDLRDVCDKL